ncbi:MAG TPA: hypothetical protein VLG71_01145 [Candidatus Limnocylindria bacterium]|nr:hypothetical protein [Candidatus Limnocylindria bacterium]
MYNHNNALGSLLVILGFGLLIYIVSPLLPRIFGVLIALWMISYGLRLRGVAMMQRMFFR